LKKKFFPPENTSLTVISISKKLTNC